jgi:hypothetical protein
MPYGADYCKARALFCPVFTRSSLRLVFVRHQSILLICRIGMAGPVEAEATRPASPLDRPSDLFRTYNLHNVSY